jgi:hypothetical protein
MIVSGSQTCRFVGVQVTDADAAHVTLSLAVAELVPDPFVAVTLQVMAFALSAVTRVYVSVVALEMLTPARCHWYP